MTYFREAVASNAKNPEQTKAQKRVHDYVAGFKTYITKSTMLQTFPQQDQRWMEFRQDASDQADKMRAQGKSEQEIKDAVRSMIPRYQIGTKQGIGYMSSRASNAPTPLPPVSGGVQWQKGMTMDDLDKQLSGGK